MPPRAVLVGLPGVGKSTVGRRLAARLATPFADSDQLVTGLTGRSVAEIFAQDGEPAFRALEASVITAALRDFEGVLALGGGAVGSDPVRQALTGSPAPVVLLTAATEDLLARIGGTRHRPLLAADPAAALAQLQVDRAPLYRAVATATVDTTGSSVETVVARLLALLNRSSPTRQRAE
jgi:shikimate kinase